MFHARTTSQLVLWIASLLENTDINALLTVGGGGGGGAAPGAAAAGGAAPAAEKKEEKKVCSALITH